MKCPSCGSEMNNNVVCPICGSPVNPNQSTEGDLQPVYTGTEQTDMPTYTRSKK